MKRLLAVLLALLMAIGVFSVGGAALEPAEFAPFSASAEDEFTTEQLAWYFFASDIISLAALPAAFLPDVTRADWNTAVNEVRWSQLPILNDVEVMEIMLTRLDEFFEPQAVDFSRQSARFRLMLDLAYFEGSAELYNQVWQIFDRYEFSMLGHMADAGQWNSLFRIYSRMNSDARRLLRRNSISVPDYEYTPRINMVSRTYYVSSFRNWFLFIVAGGWAWMWFNNLVWRVMVPAFS